MSIEHPLQPFELAVDRVLLVRNGGFRSIYCLASAKFTVQFTGSTSGNHPHRGQIGTDGAKDSMWLKRMLKDRQEIIVLGELLLFLGAWGLCIAAAVEDHRVRHNDNAEDNIAANTDFSQPGYSDQRGRFE